MFHFGFRVVEILEQDWDKFGTGFWGSYYAWADLKSICSKIFFWFFEIHKFSCFLSQFRSPHLTLDIRSWSRGSPFVMRYRKAGLPYAIRIRKRGDSLSMYVSRMTRTENFLRQKFQNFSWKSLFSTVHVTLIIMSRKYFFGFSKFISFHVFYPNFEVSTSPSIYDLGVEVPPL